MYAVGVDSGTQGTKVLVIDFNGEVRGRGYAPHQSIEGLKPGESEQDPSVWIEALEKALGQALKEAQIAAAKIVSLGVSGQQHGFVPLDKEGRPIRPAKLWNDTSTVEETKFLIDQLGGKKPYIAKLGVSLAVGYTASKILWLRQHEPENYDRLSTVLLPHNYINYVLTGRRHMEYGDASGTGLMDIRKLEWHTEAVPAVGPDLEKKLPPLSHPKEPVGSMRQEFTQRFALEDVLVSSGGGDNMMGAIGSGNVVPGICSLSLGTSGTIYSFFDSPFIDPEGEIAAFCDSTGGWLPLLCTMNVTNTTEFFKALLDISNKELEALGAKTPAGAEGLIFLPFIDGERVPALPSARGVFYGLDSKNFKSTHLARAVLEGTILNLGYGYSRMLSLGLKPEEIRATGGGAKSRLWLQIAANILQTPVVTLREEEAAALGAAIQSIWNYFLSRGEKVSINDLTDQIVALGDVTVEPDPETFPLYVHLQERFNALWQTLFLGSVAVE
ncbi:MAG: xylulokinase [Candidatus Aminicenantes bacterium]|jgi:xylulokinase